MVNAFSTSVIHGYYKYQPAVIRPTDCSWTENGTSTITNAYSNTLATNDLKRDIFSDVNRILSEKLQEKKITAYTLDKRDGSYGNRPNSLPYIYERDEKKWTQKELDQGTWHPRIKMIEKAYECNNIFVLSVVPKNPSIDQTWYFKSLLTHDNMYDFEGSGQGYHQSFESNDGTQLENPQRALPQGGFIKPFETFYADNILPTLDLENLPPEVQIKNVLNSEDIDTVVQLHFPENTQPYANSILNSFLDDTEATHLGLLTLNPHQQLIFTKV